MECYLSIKRKEVLIHAAIWINTENIRLNEIIQVQKDKFPMTPLT